MAPDRLALPITRMGTAAQAFLSPGLCGQVLAVFSGVAYLQASTGELVWIASAGAPMHRRGLESALPLPCLSAGAPFCVLDQRLTIGHELVVDASGAALWQPQRISPQQAVQPRAVPSRVRALAEKLDFSLARGFGRFIPDLLHAGAGESASDSLVLAHAGPLVLSMADACSKREQRRIALNAEALIGLGEGLTPSGDDFLGGLLFGLRSLFDLYPSRIDLDVASLLEPCRLCTNPISFALMDDLANGFGIEPLHIVANGILCGANPDDVRFAVLQLTQVGHSSGWDVLTGLFTALLAMP